MARQKKAIQITPTDEHPVPYDLTDEETGSFLEEMLVAGNTAELLKNMGAPLPEVDESNYEQEKALLKEAIGSQDKNALQSYPAALGAYQFIQSYGASLAHDVAQVRNALTNKLLELADCGNPRFELKAIELLGKHSDISLFTERSEINVTYNSPEALENAILERVNRLIHAKPLDVSPLGADLDEELGRFEPEPVEGEYEEVDETPEGDEDE